MHSEQRQQQHDARGVCGFEAILTGNSEEQDRHVGGEVYEVLAVDHPFAVLKCYRAPGEHFTATMDVRNFETRKVNAEYTRVMTTAPAREPRWFEFWK